MDTPDVTPNPEVDISLIDECLRLTPLERLRRNQEMVSAITVLREAFHATAARNSKKPG